MKNTCHSSLHFVFLLLYVNNALVNCRVRRYRFISLCLIVFCRSEWVFLKLLSESHWHCFSWETHLVRWIPVQLCELALSFREHFAQQFSLSAFSKESETLALAFLRRSVASVGRHLQGILEIDAAKGSGSRVVPNGSWRLAWNSQRPASVRPSVRESCCVKRGCMVIRARSKRKLKEISCGERWVQQIT